MDKTHRFAFFLALSTALAVTACGGDATTDSASSAAPSQNQAADADEGQVPGAAESDSAQSGDASEAGSVEGGTARAANVAAEGVTFVCSDGDGADACADGTSVVVAEISSENFSFQESLFPEPTVALLDVTNRIVGDHDTFVDTTGQILGVLTDPLFPQPGQARIDLPITPRGGRIDVDNDEDDDAGVQVYGLLLASNLFGDSYVHQLEQTSGLASWLQDVATGDVAEGTFLVHAPDDRQGFPAGFGEDGIWFTDDDPIMQVPAGYSAVTLGADGGVTVDRSSEVAMNTREHPAAASPDFSDQGILESFESLIDLLDERYAYTELRGLDWQAIRAEYLPRVQEADANDDGAAYYAAVKQLALSIGDAHVGVVAYGNPAAVAADAKAQRDRYAGTVGARVINVSTEDAPGDPPGDRFVVLETAEGSPAADAGWQAGTEVVAIDGIDVGDYVDTLTPLVPVGTDEARRSMMSRHALRFPLGQTVEVAYRAPGAVDVVTATMVAGDHPFSDPAAEALGDELRQTPVTYEQRGDVSIVRWSDFMGYIQAKIAVLEEALAAAAHNDSAAMILDLRGNSGGWVTLYETMASYFFAEDTPMPTDVFDWWEYDDKTGSLVQYFAPAYELSAPNPALAYSGPLVVLVDQSCASACEYFTQHLQVLDRATVIGQLTSEGAGGPVNQVQLPKGITMTFTHGRTMFAGTNEPNLEAKGVELDVRVPVTLETEQAKARGEDPVMEAALDYLQTAVAEAKATELLGTSWQLTQSLRSDGSSAEIAEPSLYVVAFGEDGSLTVQADCNEVAGTYVVGEDGSLTLDLGADALEACPGDSLGEAFLDGLGAATSYELDGTDLVIVGTPDSDFFVLGFAPAP